MKAMGSRMKLSSPIQVKVMTALTALLGRWVRWLRALARSRDDTRVG